MERFRIMKFSEPWANLNLVFRVRLHKESPQKLDGPILVHLFIAQYQHNLIFNLSFLTKPDTLTLMSAKLVTILGEGSFTLSDLFICLFIHSFIHSFTSDVAED